MAVSTSWNAPGKEGAWRQKTSRLGVVGRLVPGDYQMKFGSAGHYLCVVLRWITQKRYIDKKKLDLVHADLEL